MRKLAFSTNAYLRYPFDEAAARIASFGYDGLELHGRRPARLAGRVSCPRPKRAIREAMERNGLAFSNVNAFMMNAINDHRQPYWYPSFIEPDEIYRRVRIDHTQAGAEPLRRAGRAAHHDRAGRADRAGADPATGDRPVRRGPQAAGRACPQGRACCS